MQVAVRVSLPLNLPANRQAVTDMWSPPGGSAALVLLRVSARLPFCDATAPLVNRSVCNSSAAQKTINMMITCPVDVSSPDS